MGVHDVRHPGWRPRTPRGVAPRRILACVLMAAAAQACASGAADPPPDGAEPALAVDTTATGPANPPGADMDAPASAEAAPPGFERLYEDGAWAEAVAAFEADTALHSDERALYRVGLIYARPGGPAFRPDRARQRLGRLLELHPRSEYAPSARVVLDLIGRIDSLGRDLAALQEQLDRLKAVDLKPPPPPPPPPSRE